jgi:hypothetical protein
MVNDQKSELVTVKDDIQLIRRCADQPLSASGRASPPVPSPPGASQQGDLRVRSQGCRRTRAPARGIADRADASNDAVMRDQGAPVLVSISGICAEALVSAFSSPSHSA